MADEVERALSTLEQYKRETGGISRVYLGKKFQESVAEIRRMQGRVLAMKAPEPKNGITDDMIQRAKEYPFEQLIELRMGRAKCPFHDGKSATSFSVKDNRGYCFGCGWKGDAIAFVMDRDGMTFPEAVRYLQ